MIWFDCNHLSINYFKVGIEMQFIHINNDLKFSFFFIFYLF